MHPASTSRRRSWHQVPNRAITGFSSHSADQRPPPDDSVRSWSRGYIFKHT